MQNLCIPAYCLYSCLACCYTLHLPTFTHLLPVHTHILPLCLLYTQWWLCGSQVPVGCGPPGGGGPVHRPPATPPASAFAHCLEEEEEEEERKEKPSLQRGRKEGRKEDRCSCRTTHTLYLVYLARWLTFCLYDCLPRGRRSTPDATFACRRFWRTPPAPPPPRTATPPVAVVGYCRALVTFATDLHLRIYATRHTYGATPPCAGHAFTHRRGSTARRLPLYIFTICNSH